MKNRITDTLLRTLTSEDLRVNDVDIPGFHIRLGRPNTDGHRLVSYYFFYRLGGKNGRQVNFFIGNSSSLSAGEARRIALQIQPLVKAGKNLEKMQFEQQTSAVKLKDFWQFVGLEKFKKYYKNSQDPIRNIEGFILPMIGSVTLDQIDLRLIELRVFKPLLKNNKRSYLRIVAAQLNALFKMAVAEGAISQSQFIPFVVKLSPIIKSSMTLTKMTGAQIKGIYYRASKIENHPAFLYCLRLQILSGQSLAVICRSYRQDVKANKWLLRNSDGKLSGRIIPLSGPLKSLTKFILKTFPKPNSLYLFPGQHRQGASQDDATMDIRALAKGQKRFIESVHQIAITQRDFLVNIEQAMISQKINPLAVAYIFDKKLASNLMVAPEDPIIATALTQWHQA
ncbi:MAG: DUF4102 domain-containing protein [Gammaproteobacteria bacterium]|nr:DUF4102 domain-containing protein [Gammaproteobacteria bacterium]